ncbi:2-isopropylmalate synthase [Convivina praedatoris]|uniref:2-isopropylmalate synthase n=1 Tax=Convivina praedatoris TaxID=2880963 RepID=A0ABN8H7A7_9LACO|nr:2-isopropylmalate synthase [Convivina sp. LMG 32447]CAH1850271.1 2-isopropylmalate synthase [Convivina sp. LMG 32447]CAH1850920.1 2-isopropylmalate synthase [Convivina sp. LMG 32447]CAH1850934.1 2-isopropylmalate synthase [Convivina sp. LMG 32447]
MRKITFYDTTLRDGEQTIGVNFSNQEKVSIAEALEAYGVDAIETGFPAASEKDFRAVQAIAKTIQHSKVVGLARMVRKDIDAVIEATRGAVHPAIHIFIATSPVHRESKLHMSKKEILDKITADITYVKNYMDDIIFSPEDATRTEPEFLIQAVQRAIDAGAKMINIPDTVGYATPDEFGQIFENFSNQIKEFNEIGWSTHTHNDLGLANANALAGIEHGATEVQGTINGIGERAGNVDLIETAVALQVRQNKFQVSTNIDLVQSKKISNQVARMSKIAIAPNKPIMGRNAFAHESGIHQDGYLKNPETYEILNPAMVGAKASLPLGKLSGSHAVMSKLNEMGYEIGKEDMQIIFPHFKAVAEEVDIVDEGQLESMMASIYEKRVVNG